MWLPILIPHYVQKKKHGLNTETSDHVTCMYPAGVSLTSIIVYCANQDELDLWFGLLKENIEANGGTATATENYTRVKVSCPKLFNAALFDHTWKCM